VRSMATPPTQRMRELERLLAKIRNAGMAQLNYDMWEHGGAAHASLEQRASMEADLAEASRDRPQLVILATSLPTAGSSDCDHNRPRR
jgi:hypothetical protein